MRTGGNGYQLIDRFGVAVESASRRPASLPALQVAAGPGPVPPSVPALRGSPAVYAAAVVLHEAAAGLVSPGRY